MQTMKINSQKIKNELRRLGLTREVFAKSIGMTRQGFEQVLTRRKTTFKTLNKIADKLSLDAKDIVV